MKKPIYKEYVGAPHLQHLSIEARDKIFIADTLRYQEYLQNDKNNLFDFNNDDIEDIEEVLI